MFKISVLSAFAPQRDTHPFMASVIASGIVYSGYDKTAMFKTGKDITGNRATLRFDYAADAISDAYFFENEWIFTDQLRSYMGSGRVFSRASLEINGIVRNFVGNHEEIAATHWSHQGRQSYSLSTRAITQTADQGTDDELSLVWFVAGVARAQVHGLTMPYSKTGEAGTGRFRLQAHKMLNGTPSETMNTYGSIAFDNVTIIAGDDPVLHKPAPSLGARLFATMVGNHSAYRKVAR